VGMTTDCGHAPLAVCLWPQVHRVGERFGPLPARSAVVRCGHTCQWTSALTMAERNVRALLLNVRVNACPIEQYAEWTHTSLSYAVIHHATQPSEHPKAQRTAEAARTACAVLCCAVLNLLETLRTKCHCCRPR
jgi:hypothetical protein